MPVKATSESTFASTFTGNGTSVELDGKMLLFKSVALAAPTGSTAATTAAPTSAAITVTMTETSTSVVSSTSESPTTTDRGTTTPAVTTVSTTVTEDPSLNSAVGGVGMSDSDRLTVIICVVAGVVVIICVIVVVVVCQKKGTDRHDGSSKAQRIANVSEESSKEAYGHRDPRSLRQWQHRQKAANDAPADTDTIDVDVVGQEEHESVVGLSDVEMNAI